MGYRLSREVEEHAPASLTWRELCVLHILATAAWDTGKRARQIPHIEGNKDLIHRLRMPNRSTRFEVIQSLIDKGALIRQERGRHGTAAAYRIPDFSELEGPGNPDATEGAKGPGFPVEGSGFSGRRVRVSPAKGPGLPDPITTSTKKEPYTKPRKNTAAAPQQPLWPTAVNRDEKPDGEEPHGEEPAPGFDAFWAVYPRKVGKKGARSCYDRAVKGSKDAERADPRVIIAGAERYRDDPNRVDQFTKHPSTWLNNGCWDDEPLPPRYDAGRQGRDRLDQAAAVAAANRVNGQPSAAMAAFAAGMTTKTEESRREITS